MIDSKIFDELMNRGIITQVGLNPENYKDIEDLKRHGLATSIASTEVYEDVVNDLINTEEILNKFMSDIAVGGTVVVPMDLQLASPIIIEKDVTIDLNGYTLIAPVFAEKNGAVVEGNSDSYVFWVKKGTLTISGEGNVISKDAEYSIAVWANGGNVVINGGKFENSGDGCDLIYLSSKANVEINAGEFIATERTGAAAGTLNKRSAINIKDKDKATCTVSVKGGKFLEFDPKDNLSESPKYNFLAEGYESTKEGDWYVVSEVKEIVVDDNKE